MANYICKASPFKATNCDGNCSCCQSARKNNYSCSTIREDATIVPSHYLPFTTKEERQYGRVQSI